MEIKPTSNIQFTSRLNPIKPISVMTDLGKIDIVEVPYKKAKDKALIRNVIDFINENIYTVTNHPFFRFLKTAPKEEYDRLTNLVVDRIMELIKRDDGNFTLLLAKDAQNKIQGACMSYGCPYIPKARKLACYIEGIGVNSRYRGNNIGKIMLESTLKANKKTFTDVYLFGEIESAGFYKKLGFKDLDPKDFAQLKIIYMLTKHRDDFPKYINLLSKPIQENKPRWYEILK